MLLIDTDIPEVKPDELAETEGTWQDAKLVEVAVLVVVANNVVEVCCMLAIAKTLRPSAYSGE